MQRDNNKPYFFSVFFVGFNNIIQVFIKNSGTYTKIK